MATPINDAFSTPRFDEVTVDRSNNRCFQARFMSGIAIEFVDLGPASRQLVEAIVRIKLAAVRSG